LVFDDVGLTHGKLRDGGLHLAGEVSKSALEFVDLFGDLESGLSAVNSVFLQFFAQVCDFVQNQLFFQQLFLLTVKPLFKNADLGV